jgi:hypothetical protein
MSRSKWMVIAFTIALLAAWARIRAVRQWGFQSGPEETIYGMEGAARVGDVQVYLQAFADPMQSRLERLVAESGSERFAESLRENSRDVLGIALSESLSAAGQETAFRVERIYSDHNSSQVFYLVRAGGGWRISRTGEDQQTSALVPYGTPVRFR